tara:strand:+ start:316 stop:657 length:342 start_codon:yes stop_codon:yes gene_type:complete
MSDLEITRLCAEAMGLPVRASPFGGGHPFVPCGNAERDVVDSQGPLKIYDPLHDDAQAMALVKTFKLRIDRDRGIPERWGVFSKPTFGDVHINADLNRAICECCARMQLEKSK